MKISVIIPVYNAQDTIIPCLEALVTQDSKPYEILLVDNNSQDASVDKIQEFIIGHPSFKISLFKEVKKGPSAARNKGLEYAQGEIIAFTDSDCIPKQDWLKNIAQLHEDNPGIDAFGGIAYIYNPKGVAQKLEASDNIFDATIQARLVEKRHEMLFGGIIATLNCSYKRKLLKDLGGFDENLCIGEDVDLTIRSFDRGYKIIIWHPKLCVWHMPRKTWRLFLKKIFYYRLYLPVILKKHFKKRLYLELPKLGVKEFPFFCELLITSNFIFLMSFIILIIVFFKFFPIILAVFLAVAFFKFIKNLMLARQLIGLKFSFAELLILAILEVIKKGVSEGGKLCGAFKTGAFYL